MSINYGPGKFYVPGDDNQWHEVGTTDPMTLSGQHLLPSVQTPKHTLRNAIILGAFIAIVITSGLEAAGILNLNFFTLLFGTMLGYSALAGAALLVWTLATGKNIHQ